MLSGLAAVVDYSVSCVALACTGFERQRRREKEVDLAKKKKEEDYEMERGLDATPSSSCC